MVISKMQSILRVSGTVSPRLSVHIPALQLWSLGQGVHSQPTSLYDRRDQQEEPHLQESREDRGPV